MPNILISNIGFGRAAPQALESLKLHANVIENLEGKRFDEVDFMTLLPEAQVLIAGTERISETVLRNAKNLKLVARVGAGLDNLDKKTIAEQKISITYTPEAPALSVPEFTLALILNLLKGIQSSDNKLRKNQWYRPQGRMLSSMVYGIIGAGNIGKKVISLISAVSPEAKILFYDPQIEKVDNADKVSMDELIKRSDVISLHLPLYEQTTKLINTNFLNKMKDNSYLVNTSRGAVVDEGALYNALSEGKLAGAALDVFDTEPYNGKLIQLENCILTSHIASMTKEVRSLMEKQVVEDVIRFFEKKPLLRPFEGFDFRNTP